MDFQDFTKERTIRRVLRSLSRQRVAVICQPGDVWVIEYAPPEFDGLAEALRTCHLRGWVEPIANAVPSAWLTPDGHLPEDFQKREPVYRLTEAGWAVLNRTQVWVVATFSIAAATLIATVATLFVASCVSR